MDVLNTNIKIKEGNTRISYWYNNKRFAKKENNIIIATYGFSNKEKEKWKKYIINNNEIEILNKIYGRISYRNIQNIFD